jgi:hypothetical protein
MKETLRLIFAKQKGRTRTGQVALDLRYCLYPLRYAAMMFGWMFINKEAGFSFLAYTFYKAIINQHKAKICTGKKFFFLFFCF